MVLNGDIVVAVSGGYGTLSEIGLAKKIDRPVIALGRWKEIKGVIPAKDPRDVIRIIKKNKIKFIRRAIFFMKRLFAPWRIEYILGPKPDECVFFALRIF